MLLRAANNDGVNPWNDVELVIKARILLDPWRGDAPHLTSNREDINICNQVARA
jgi:hypothetical protein